MILVQVVNGLTEGVMLFLIASGLTLIFGVSRIINFAHGSLYMIGAFLTFQMAPWLAGGGMAGFFLTVVVSGLLVAALGCISEMLLLRRIYASEELLQLIITVAMVLVIRDVVKEVWGLNEVSTPIPAGLSGALRVSGNYFPAYQLAVMGAGLGVMLLTSLVMRYTRFGIILRAATDDRGMVALLGVNQAYVFTGVFTVGSFLAGLAGGLMAPLGNVTYLMDTTVIVTAFIVVVIGGLGNLYGALAAALTVGVLRSLGLLWFPRLSMVLVFLVMATVLIARSLGRRVE